MTNISQVLNQHFTGDLFIMRHNDGRNSTAGDVNVIATVMRPALDFENSKSH